MKHLQQFESFSSLRESLDLISPEVEKAIGELKISQENTKTPQSAELPVNSSEWKKLVAALSTVSPAPKVNNRIISFNPPSMGPEFGMSLSNIIYDTKDGLALKLWISVPPAMKKKISDVWKLSSFKDEYDFAKDYFIITVDPKLNTVPDLLKKTIQETLDLGKSKG